MKQLLIIVFFTCLTLNCLGQENYIMTYNQIKTAIEKKGSKAYYPNILKRYLDFDTTLTAHDYLYAYYGFSFQDDYFPDPSDDSLRYALKSTDYQKVILECEKILEQNPFNLDANNYMGYALFKLNKPESEWKKYQNRYRAIRKVIANSGDGLSEKTAFKVISISDEYNMMSSYFEIKEIHEQALVGTCDRFKVTPSEYYKSNMIFFDYTQGLKFEESLFK